MCGDTLDILRYGVGHYAGSFFPGEGGSVIFAAHNNYFRKLNQTKIPMRAILGQREAPVTGGGGANE